MSRRRCGLWIRFWSGHWIPVRSGHWIGIGCRYCIKSTTSHDIWATAVQTTKFVKFAASYKDSVAVVVTIAIADRLLTLHYWATFIDVDRNQAPVLNLVILDLATRNQVALALETTEFTIGATSNELAITIIVAVATTDRRLRNSKILALSCLHRSQAHPFGCGSS